MLLPLYIKICLLAQEFLVETRQTQIKNPVVALKKQLIVGVGGKVCDKKIIFSLDNNVALKLAYSRSFSKSSPRYYKFAPSRKHYHQEQMA